MILLHGLAGHAEEWTDTAANLVELQHVIALDVRGHGFSETRPAEVGPSVQAADVEFVVRQLGIERAVVVGQSMGGLTALVIAATNQALVSAAVLVEAGPEADDEASLAKVDDYLRGWPLPFPIAPLQSGSLAAGPSGHGAGRTASWRRPTDSGRASTRKCWRE